MQPRHLLFTRNTHRDTSAARIFFVLALLAAGVFALDRFSQGSVRGVLQDTGGLVSAAVVSVADALPSAQGFAAHATLVADIQALEDTLARREEQDARFAALRAENEELRELARLAEDESTGLSAPVLSSFSSSPYGTFVIGAGARHDVRENAVVLTPGGFVLGRVVAVQDRTSTVEALFAPGKETEATIGNVPFLLQGRGGGNARAETPRDASILEGDVVHIPSFGGRPAGFVFEKESASSSAATTLYIRTPANLDTLRYVYIVQ